MHQALLMAIQCVKALYSRTTTVSGTLWRPGGICFPPSIEPDGYGARHHDAAAGALSQLWTGLHSPEEDAKALEPDHPVVPSAPGTVVWERRRPTFWVRRLSLKSKQLSCT